MNIFRSSFLICCLLASANTHAQIDFQKAFDDCGVDGSITIYDYKADKWIMSRPLDSQHGTLPASTFKILNTLIALETGAVTDENELVKWSGITDTSKYGYRPNIYHDMGLKEAFKVSAVWVHLDLAEKIGKEKYSDFLLRSNYGNADNSIENLDFWNFGKLVISPINQIELLKGVYEETLPFSKRSFKILKEIMVEEETENYTLRAKTGWTRVNGKNTGWWVGYVTKKDNAYFFATRLTKDGNIDIQNFINCRKEVTKHILTQLGIID